MALADFLTLLLIPFTLHSAVSFSWPLSDTSCKIYQFLLAFSLAASTYSLCAVSIARAMIITNPYHPPSTDLLALMLILAWALSFFISLPLRIFATKERLGPGLTNFTFCLPTIKEHHYQVILSQFVLYYFIPMLVIAGNYVRLALFLHKSPVMSMASARNTRRASLMVFLAAGTFSVCWLPGYVFELCVYLGLYKHGQAWEMFYFTCTVLQYLHPCVNPVLYVLLAKRYRGMQRAWLFQCSRNRVHPQVISVTESFWTVLQGSDFVLKKNNLQKSHFKSYILEKWNAMWQINLLNAKIFFQQMHLKIKGPVQLRSGSFLYLSK